VTGSDSPVSDDSSIFMDSPWPMSCSTDKESSEGKPTLQPDIWQGWRQSWGNPACLLLLLAAHHASCMILRACSLPMCSRVTKEPIH
jgi:hypothetical protein